MPIELKGLNYYSKVFKRVNYKLSNSTFWVVIRRQHVTIHLLLQLSTAWFWRTKKKFSAQNFAHFSTKILRFPSSNINPSIQTQKNAQKTHNSKNQTSPNFLISSNELQKSQKLMGFAPNNILYKSPTSIKLENQELTPNEKKTPKNVFCNQKTRNKKLTQNCSSNVNNVCSDTNWREFKSHRITC